jgi:hypothetical protein
MDTYFIFSRSMYGDWGREWSGDKLSEFNKYVQEHLDNEDVPGRDFLAMKNQCFPEEANVPLSQDDIMGIKSDQARQERKARAA